MRLYNNGRLYVKKYNLSVQFLLTSAKRGRPRKHLVLSTKPVSVREIAEDSSIPWETVVLAEGAKDPILAERNYIALLCLP